MDLENGGGGALNNTSNQPMLHPHHQDEEEEDDDDEAGGAGDHYPAAKPDPAADYVSSGVLCVLGLVTALLLSVSALLLGLAVLASSPSVFTWSGELGGWVLSHSAAGMVFMLEFLCGLVALGAGLGSAFVLAVRCCRGSHSLSTGTDQLRMR